MELRGLDDKTNSIKINKNKFTIGRLKSCDHVISDGVISRVHATIFRHNDEWLFKDTSANGVIVENKCVGHGNTVTLHNGDLIVLDPLNRNRYVVAQPLQEVDSAPSEDGRVDCTIAGRVIASDTGGGPVSCAHSVVKSNASFIGLNPLPNICSTAGDCHGLSRLSTCTAAPITTPNVATNSVSIVNTIPSLSTSFSSTVFSISSKISSSVAPAAPVLCGSTNFATSTAPVSTSPLIPVSGSTSCALSITSVSGSINSAPSLTPVSGSKSSALSIIPASGSTSSAPSLTPVSGSTSSASSIISTSGSATFDSSTAPSIEYKSSAPAIAHTSESTSSAPPTTHLSQSTGSAPSTTHPSESEDTAPLTTSSSGSTRSALSTALSSVSTSCSSSVAPILSGSTNSLLPVAPTNSGSANSISSTDPSRASTSSAPQESRLALEQIISADSNNSSSSSITEYFAEHDHADGPSAKRRKLVDADDRFVDLEAERQAVRDELHLQRIEYEAEKTRLLQLISKLEQQVDVRLGLAAAENQQERQKLQDALSEACKQRDELSSRLTSTNDSLLKQNQTGPSTSRINISNDSSTTSAQTTSDPALQHGEESRRRDSGVLRNELATYAESELTCSICMEFFIDPVTLHCGHSFCQHCIDSWYVRESRICPMCRNHAATAYTRSIVLQSCTDALVRRLDQSRRDHYDALRRERQQEAASSRNRNSQQRRSASTFSTDSGSLNPAPDVIWRARRRRGSRGIHVPDWVINLLPNHTVGTRSRRGAGRGVSTRSTSSSIEPPATRARRGRGRRRGRGTSDPVSSCVAAVNEVSLPTSSPSSTTVQQEDQSVLRIPSSSSSSSSSSPLVTNHARNCSVHIISSDSSSDASETAHTLQLQVDPTFINDSEQSSSTHSETTPVSSSDVTTSDTGLDDDDHVTRDGDQSPSSTSSSSVEGFSYYGGYGRCFRCGCRGHWAPGCPFRYQ